MSLATSAAFVHFNDVYNFKIGKPCTYNLHRPHLYTHAVGKWSWDNAAKIWSMKRDIIASQCGYNGDAAACTGVQNERLCEVGIV